MKTTQSEKSQLKKLRWSAALLLAGFLIGSLLPSTGERVEAAGQNQPAYSCPDPTIVLWTFTGDTTNPSDGSGILDYGSDVSGPVFYAGPGGGGDRAINFRGWNSPSQNENDFLEFQINTLGKNSIKLNFDSRVTSTGPISFDIYYAIDGGSFVQFGLPETLTNDSNWYSKKIDFSSVPNLDNKSDVVFRLYSYGASASSGNWRLDNVTFLGSCEEAPIINEIAWAGTEASFDDEWIELYSPGGGNFNLTGWRLVADDGSPDIVLSGFTSDDGYFLLERAREENVVTGIAKIDGGISNQIYLGLLEDTGEILRLRAPDGTIMDTANGNGGAWSHGRSSPASSMERMSTSADADDNWVTNIGTHANGNSNGQDAAGNDIYGSPGQANWGYGVTYTPTNTATSTATNTPTATQTFTPTSTNTATVTATAPASLTILINEIGWSGTAASSSDEWIELYNASNFVIDFDAGWKLISTDGGIDITLTGTIADGDYYLLERTDDNTISDISADLIYSGSLSNDGEYLKLLAPDGSVVDTANNDGGSWSAGSASPNYGSMERNGTTADKTSAWFTNTGAVRNGLDAEGNAINGTPKESNWAITVTATASPYPTRTLIPLTPTPTSYPYQSIVLNEVLPRPGHDWNGDGVVNTNDEFIEIINRGNGAINLGNWKLQIVSDSSVFPFPNFTLPAGERVAIFGSISHLHLSDGGDTLRLLKNNNQIADVLTYTVVKAADYSWCRFPEHGFWNTDCFPTPNEENALHGAFNDDLYIQVACAVPDTVPEIITLIECGTLGVDIIDADYWNHDFWEMWITGRAKRPTWVR